MSEVGGGRSERQRWEGNRTQVEATVRIVRRRDVCKRAEGRSHENGFRGPALDFATNAWNFVLFLSNSSVSESSSCGSSG